MVEIITDFPGATDRRNEFGLGENESPMPSRGFRIRYHKRRWLMSVQDVRDRDAADAWRGRYFFLPEQSLDELPEGFYYEHHLVGLACRSPEGEELGEIPGRRTGAGPAEAHRAPRPPRIPRSLCSRDRRQRRSGRGHRDYRCPAWPPRRRIHHGITQISSLFLRISFFRATHHPEEDEKRRKRVGTLLTT